MTANLVRIKPVIIGFAIISRIVPTQILNGEKKEDFILAVKVFHFLFFFFHKGFMLVKHIRKYSL